jgi:hypothetical protein
MEETKRVMVRWYLYRTILDLEVNVHTCLFIHAYNMEGGENKITRIVLDKENEVDREKKPTDMDEENDDNLWRRRMEMKLTRRMDMIFDGECSR